MDNTKLVRVGPLPLHQQITERLRSKILGGNWPSHYKLRCEPDLAQEFGVSRGTVRRALRTLIGEGLLVQVQGKGTFVAAEGIEQSIAQELLSLSEAMERQGIPFETEVRSSLLATPSENVLALLHLPPDAKVFRLVRRRSVHGAWVALLVNEVRSDVCPRIEAQDFASRTLFGVLEHEYRLRPDSAHRTFQATPADDYVAHELDVPIGSPVLYMEQITYAADGSPIEHSDVWIRGDKFRLSSVLKRR